MSKINILSENIANQIAAGEVVERPVAIVKELLENSIDAGAKKISVIFLNGGKNKIIVEDDGCGMSPKDAKLSILRHATSKLNIISDLQQLNTFGFRGEALPSIASVSRFLLRTRTQENDLGTEILVNGGKVVQITECSMSVGTMIEVSNLFHNVPARRRFLKTDETEEGHIIKMVKSFMFAEPNLHIELFEGTKKISTSSTANDWSIRVKDIFGISEDLMNIFYEKNGLSVCGAICKPGVGDSNQRNIMTFVNNRLVTSSLMNIAINDAFAGFLPINRKPVAFVMLNLEKAGVDVNVHPTKREIRFRNETFVKNFIKEAIVFQIKNMCMGDMSVDSSIHRDTKSVFLPEFIRKANYSYGVDKNQKNYQSTEPKSGYYKSNIWQEIQEPPSNVGFISQKTNNMLDFDMNQFDWKFIGCVQEHCVVFESKHGLEVLNTKLAVRRIIYENILDNISFDSQNMLIPVEINFDKQDTEKVEILLPFFEKYGFQIYQSGENTLKISSLPSWFDVGLAEVAVIDILEKAYGDEQEFLKNFAKSLSYWVSSDKYRTEEEVKELLNLLAKCKLSTICPRGNQIFFEIPFADFRKRFGC